jgi:hypothetical protein
MYINCFLCFTIFLLYTNILSRTGYFGLRHFELKSTQSNEVRRNQMHPLQIFFKVLDLFKSQFRLNHVIPDGIFDCNFITLLFCENKRDKVLSYKDSIGVLNFQKRLMYANE